ncbi:YlmC/YmxH family sporulation protein [Brevibacillus fulvus]|uniref:YlmC/YmxH family sporulation protein n=1 Tax=Brevibacillus fulvus TaxID=1125967 RepID=A0A938XZJ5_9BACL|nr:YlmC/YmxH family sporulation protein [Brevibacillus fulvus]MBM7590570.1 YlmC/YmxH family sporulation protein [Brevibacillus fulvus]
MRFSELGNKEIIALDHGEKMGMIGNADLEIHPETGEIRSIILAAGGLLSFGKRREEIVIPWSSIVKIGPEMVIVQLRQEQANPSPK